MKNLLFIGRGSSKPTQLMGGVSSVQVTCVLHTGQLMQHGERSRHTFSSLTQTGYSQRRARRAGICSVANRARLTLLELKAEPVVLKQKVIAV